MVTRQTIADAVADLFDSPPVTKGNLVHAAGSDGADAEVVAALYGLPEQSFRSIRELWPHLRDVPVE